MKPKIYKIENDMDSRVNPNDIRVDEILNDDNDFSVDSNGYFIGNNLTPAQEKHNLLIDNQIENN